MTPARGVGCLYLPWLVEAMCAVAITRAMTLTLATATFQGEER